MDKLLDRRQILHIVSWMCFFIVSLLFSIDGADVNVYYILLKYCVGRGELLFLF